jgi:ABC-type cobalamin/Fe3+-siderophores transport system ATPase subunit
MVMLNYFRAEADKKIKEDKEKNRRDKERGIIYAIEEPETSQHPNHQIMLINALINLSNQENYQIIITTHTPEVAKMVNEENLILINRDNNKNPIIINDEKKMKLIAKTLGIHPFYKNKVVICVEGENDIKFLKGINQAIDEYKSLIDLEKEDIDLIPLHGGNLKNWVDRHYLKNSNVIEVHIYDRDSNSGKNTKQYEKECKKINNRNDNSICLMTEKREMENYIHKSLIESEFGISLDGIKNYDEEDIPTYIKNKIVKPLKESDIKNILNGKLSKKLTKKHLEELEAFDEIKGWFEKIRELKEY